MAEKVGLCRANDCETRLFSADGAMILGVTVVLHRGRAYCAKHGEECGEVERSLGPAIMELHAHALVLTTFSLAVPCQHDYDAALYRVRRLRSMEKNLFGS